MDLKGTRAVVTGGAGSLGTAISSALAKEGCDVLITYVTSETAATELAAELSDSFGVRAIPFRIDLTQSDAPEILQRGVIDLLGGLDVLVNNAAVNQKVQFSDLDGVTSLLWDHIMNTNVRQPFMLARRLAPQLKEGRGGRIVNIGSIGGLIPGGSSIPYAVSKAALIHLTKCLAVALAPEVIVNLVAPAGFPSRMRAASLDPEQANAAVQRTILKREVALADIARQVITFCQTDSATGQSTVVDGGNVFH